MSEIQEAINSAVEKALDAIRYNITNTIQGLLYSVQLENEKQGGVADIARLIYLIISTSKYDGPEGEEYPVWIIRDKYTTDKRKKEAEQILKRLEKVLQKHGIQQSWNIKKY